MESDLTQRTGVLGQSRASQSLCCGISRFIMLFMLFASHSVCRQGMGCRREAHPSLVTSGMEYGLGVFGETGVACVCIFCA